MVAIRPLKDIVDKWATVTPDRQPFYEKGVKNPLRDWATNAAAAEDAWESGVREAATHKRFEKGVKKAGTPKWQRKASTVGPARFAEGVRAAREDYEGGFAPFHDTIAKLTLPARRKRGDPANIERVKAIASALYKKRLELLGVAPSPAS